MRKIYQLGLAAGLTPLAAHAQTFTYNYNVLNAGVLPPALNANNTAGTVPATTGIRFLGAGPDGYDANSGTSAGTGKQGTNVFNKSQDGFQNISNGSSFAGIVLDASQNPRGGLTGKYVQAYPSAAPTSGSAAPPSFDTIECHVNTAANPYNNSGYKYSIPSGSTFSAQFTAHLVTTQYGPTNVAGPGGTVNVAYSRAEAAFGYDQNNDGDIRGAAASTENAEWGPFFGYDSGAGAVTQGGTTSSQNGSLYIRAASGTTLGAVTSLSAQLTGTYVFRFDVDPTANSGNGSGSLYFEQTFDANGNAIANPSFSLGLSNVNLGLQAMTQTAAGGTAGGGDPANWNGFFTREANNGALNNFSVTVTPEPASITLLGLSGLAALRRRRA